MRGAAGPVCAHSGAATARRSVIDNKDILISIPSISYANPSCVWIQYRGASDLRGTSPVEPWRDRCLSPPCWSAHVNVTFALNQAQCEGGRPSGKILIEDCGTNSTIWSAGCIEYSQSSRCLYLPPGFIGTKLTSPANRRIMVPSAFFSIRVNSCQVDPTGATRRPPLHNCAISAWGTSGGAAVTMMPSKGASSGQPLYPSPCRTMTLE